jgi:uncharacterized protein (TIGR03083 family)
VRNASDDKTGRECKDRFVKPILTAHLFPKLDCMLLELLGSLSAGEWEKQTVSPQWKVKDVVAHLLDTALRGLSIGRDGCLPEGPRIDSRAELAGYINRLNQEGVTVYRRLSPAVLISLMQVAAKSLAEYHASRDPNATALLGVSWAGEEKSAKWFDTAREFTERWHHQQQIRLAVDKPGIMTRELYHPVLDCFLRALPFTYRGVSANKHGNLSKRRAAKKFPIPPFHRKSPGAFSPRASIVNRPSRR